MITYRFGHLNKGRSREQNANPDIKGETELIQCLSLMKIITIKKPILISKVKPTYLNDKNSENKKK